MHTIMIYFSTRTTCNVAQYFMTCVLFLTLVIRVRFLGNFRGWLVCVFKQLFSIFKQHFTHFNTLFHPHVFPQIFLNNNFQFLNTHTKRALILSLPLKLLNWKKKNQNYSQRLVKNKNKNYIKRTFLTCQKANKKKL